MSRHRHKAGQSKLGGKFRNPRSAIIASQAVYSLNNLAFTVLVAHFGGVADVGVSAIYMSVTAVCLGVSRAVFVEPMLLSNRKDSQTDYLMLVILFAAVIALSGLLAAMALSLDLKGPLVLAGASIVVQDFVRQVNFANARPVRTLAIDLFWLLSLAAYGINGLLADGESVFRAWSAASVSSLLLGILLAEFKRPVSGGVGRIKESSSGLVAYSLIEALVFQLIFNFGVVMAFSYFSIEAAGYYRLSTSVLAPVGLVMVALATANFVTISRGIVRIGAISRMSLQAGMVTFIAGLACVFALLALQLLDLELVAGVSLLYTAILAIQFPFYSASGPWSAYLKSSKARWSIVAARLAGIPVLIAGAGVAFSVNDVSFIYIAIALSAGAQFAVDSLLASRRFRHDTVADTVVFDNISRNSATRR